MNDYKKNIAEWTEDISPSILISVGVFVIAFIIVCAMATVMGA